MMPFTFTELLLIATDPMAFLTRPEPLHRSPEAMDNVRYHFDLGILQAAEGQVIPDVTEEEARGVDYLEAYLAGFRGEIERRRRAA